MAIGWLFERMAQWRDTRAIVWRDEPFTYMWLLDRVAFWKSQLAAAGLRSGQVASLEGDYSPNVCTLLLAMIELGVIIVPVTRAASVHRREFIDIAEVQISIVFHDAESWEIERRDVIVANPVTRRLTVLNEPGLVLFSSGSTGKSKAVLHNFRSLLEKFKTLRYQKYTLGFMLLDHIGGINTLFYTLSNGGCLVTVESRDPHSVCEAIERHRVQLLPTTPTFLNLLLVSEAYCAHDLSSLELITYGTEVMPESILKRVRDIFPGVRLLQTYGLSEVGILRSKSRDSDSLWVKVGGEGFETRVVENTLWVRAGSAMVGYLNAPSPFDEDGWINTEDMVEVDGEYIRILGRQTELINVGGEKVHPAEVESVLLEMGNIKDVVVYGEKNSLMGNVVAARINLFKPENPRDLRRRIREFCEGKLAPYKIPAKIEIIDKDQFGARYKKGRGR